MKYMHFCVVTFSCLVNNFVLHFPNDSCRLEEDPDDPEKTPTVMIQTNLQILEEMKAEFENMKL